MSDIQSISFENSKFTVESAKKFLFQHNLVPIKPPHLTLHFIRFRLKPPEQFSRFVTQHFKEGIHYIIGYY